MKAEQIKPLNPKLACIWDHDWSDYADRIKVPMQDGKVITYRREIEQPHPCFIAAMDSLERMVGYARKG